MKKFRNIVCLLLAGVLLFSAGCKKNKEEPKDEGEKFSSTYLVEDGRSPYKIVVPENASKTINSAAGELQLFFKEATGVTLSVLSDDSLSFDENGYYLSIGETGMFRGSGVETKAEELGADGLRLVTKGNTVVMAGCSDNGAMYAMYEFLERTFNLEVYAEDEYYIDKNVDDLHLKIFDVTERPAFDRRSVGLYPYSVNATFRNRMRQELYNEGWIYWSHSHFKIMPTETYYDAHKDWYSPDGTQLCLTNDEMRAEFTKNVIELVKENPDCGYIMLGQEDVNTFCTCEECLKQTAVYKNSGVMMRFVNQVADDVQRYIDENEPGRVFTLCTFGYHQTQNAPVNFVDGEYRPVDDSVLPRSNVTVMVAPIYACNSHDYYAPCNSDVEAVFKGWQAVAEGHMFVWMYNKVFKYYFIPFNNFSSIVDDYNILKDLGARFVYHQGNKETPAGGMQELMCYVQAKLMWDTSLSFDGLVNDFIDHYYKEAAPYYREYYDLVRMSYSMWEADGLHCYNSSSKAEQIYDSRYWTQNLLDKFESLFASMLEAVKGYETSDPEFYETVVQRIKKERLTSRFLYLGLYFDRLSYDEAKAMIDDFETVAAKSSISVWREMYLTTSTESLISSLLADWRAELSQK